MINLEDAALVAELLAAMELRALEDVALSSLLGGREAMLRFRSEQNAAAFARDCPGLVVDERQVEDPPIGVVTIAGPDFVHLAGPEVGAPDDAESEVLP